MENEEMLVYISEIGARQQKEQEKNESEREREEKNRRELHHNYN